MYIYKRDHNKVGSNFELMHLNSPHRHRMSERIPVWLLFFMAEVTLFHMTKAAPYQNDVVQDRITYRRTICCLCDDENEDVLKRCSTDGVCNDHYEGCENYCVSTRTRTSTGWKTSRSCGSEDFCRQSSVCNAGSNAAVGSNCTECCRAEVQSPPFYCFPDSSGNIPTIKPLLPIQKTTMKTTTTEKPTTSPTTTVKTTTTMKPTSPTTIMKITTPTTSSTTKLTSLPPRQGTICMAGQGGLYKISTCSPTQKFCMNTVNVTETDRFIQKQCVDEMTCKQRWWDETRNLNECVDPFHSPAGRKFVCNFCCQATEDRACNTNDLIIFKAQFQKTSSSTKATSPSTSKPTTSTTTKSTTMKTTVMPSTTTDTTPPTTTTTSTTQPTTSTTIQTTTTSTTSTTTQSTTETTKLTTTDEQTTTTVESTTVEPSTAILNLLTSTSSAISTLAPSAGGWSDWFPWLPCSVTCGGGITIKYRLCNNPYPAPGGQDCQGIRVEETSCNTQPCPEDTTRSITSSTHRLFTRKPDPTTTPSDQRFNSTSEPPFHSTTTGKPFHSSTTGKPFHSTTTGKPFHSMTTGKTPHHTTTGTPFSSTKGSPPDINTTTTLPTTTTIQSTLQFTCSSCDGDCRLPIPEECPDDRHYCMNTITEETDGSIKVTKGCVTQNVCHQKWYEETSDLEKCQSMLKTGVIVPGLGVTCSFCCDSDGCNFDTIPSVDLYDGSQRGDILIG